MELTAVGAPGLEHLLALELSELGLRKAKLFLPGEAEGGRVAFEGDGAALWRANLLLRTADRVLARVGRFSAGDFAALRRGTGALPWERWLAPGARVAVRARCRKSRLYHERGVAERVAEGIGDRFKRCAPLAAAEDAPLVLVSLDGDVATVDVDSSGAPLSRRGWRLAGAKAPLKETLAAALLVASGWDRRATLLDPFCGSGTIAIEAALLAAGLPPARERRYAFMDWPGFDSSAFTRARAAARGTPASPFPRIIASDRDAGAVEAARANAERAGVAGRVELSVRALSDAAVPPGPGFLVTNPPYGVRVSEGKDLRGLYARLGDVARGLGSDWTVTMLSASPALSRATGLDFDAGLPTLNGGLSVRVVSRRAR